MIELSIPVLTSEVDLKMEKLEEAGFFNICCEVPIEITTVKYGYGFQEKKEGKTKINVYIDPQEICEEAALNLIKEALGIDIVINCAEVEEDNWQLGFEVIDLKNGWIVAPPNENKELKNRIVFESLGAFGTGLHETTQDCMRMILSMDLKGKKVMDLGAGSGILSIAAGIKGAEYIVAVDISDVEKEIIHNADLNGLTNIRVFQKDVADEDFNIALSFDFIIINIGGEEFLNSFDLIHRTLETNGNLLVSGLVEWSYEEVKKEIVNSGYEEVKYASTNEWVTILFKKLV